MADDNKIKFDIEVVKDELRKSLEKSGVEGKKVDKILDDLSKPLEKIGKSKKSVQGLEKDFISLKKAVAGYVAQLGVRELNNFAKEATELSGKVQGAKRSFDNLISSRGKDPVKFFSKLKDESRGLITNLKLYEKVNLADTMGVDLNALPKLMKVAQVASVNTGESFQFMFDSIIRGSARQSALILDNLGIQMKKVDEINKDYALSIGKTVKQLDEAEKRQAFFNEVIKNSEDIIKRSGGVFDTRTSQLERQRIAWENLKVEIGDTIGDTYVNLLNDASSAVMRLFASHNTLTNSFLSEKKRFDSQSTSSLKLIDRYDELNKKSNKSTEEHKEFSRIVKTLSEQYPDYIGQLDHEGRALSVNTAGLKTHIDQQKELLKLKERDIYRNIKDKLFEYTEALTNNKSLIKKNEQDINRFNNSVSKNASSIAKNLSDKNKILSRNFDEAQRNIVQTIKQLSLFDAIKVDKDIDKITQSLSLEGKEQQTLNKFLKQYLDLIKKTNTATGVDSSKDKNKSKKKVEELSKEEKQIQDLIHQLATETEKSKALDKINFSKEGLERAKAVAELEKNIKIKEFKKTLNEQDKISKESKDRLFKDFKTEVDKEFKYKIASYKLSEEKKAEIEQGKLNNRVRQESNDIKKAKIENEEYGIEQILLLSQLEYDMKLEQYREYLEQFNELEQEKLFKQFENQAKVTKNQKDQLAIQAFELKRYNVLAGALSKPFEAMIRASIDGRKGFKAFGEAFKQMVSNMVAELLSKAILFAFLSAFTSGFGSFAKFLSKGGGVLGTFLGGAKESGTSSAIENSSLGSVIPNQNIVNDNLISNSFSNQTAYPNFDSSLITEAIQNQINNLNVNVGVEGVLDGNKIRMAVKRTEKRNLVVGRV